MALIKVKAHKRKGKVVKAHKRAVKNSSKSESITDSLGKRLRSSGFLKPIPKKKPYQF